MNGYQRIQAVLAGTWPDQRRAYFTLRDIRKTLGRATPGAGLEGSIYAGLDTLCGERFDRTYRREDGADTRSVRSASLDDGVGGARGDG